MFEGNLGKRDLSYEEPEGLGQPVKPADLDPVASECWDAHLSQVVANGACQGDSLRLAGMCRWYSAYMRLSVLVDESPSPWKLVVPCGVAWNNFSKQASLFGLSPADRARMRTDPKKTTSDFDSDVAKNA